MPKRNGKYANVTDRRERLICEGLDLYGPRIFNLQLAGMLINAARILMEKSIYENKDDKYDIRLAAADVDFVSHYMQSRWCPLLDDWETATGLRLDNIERWIKSDLMKGGEES